MKIYKLNYTLKIIHSASGNLSRDMSNLFSTQQFWMGRLGTLALYKNYGSSFRSIRDWALIKQSKKGLENSTYELAMKYFKSNEQITAAQVNGVLLFLNINITQQLLDEILSKPVLEFTDLNPNTINSDYFKEVIGTVRNERCLAGVYIWTNKLSGAKYVGSSTSLSRRLIGYFKGTHADVGKFIPLLKREGVEAFTLQVIPLTEKYYDSLELCLEQYFLLQPQFNLNTLRVVNKISGSRSKALYMYTKDLTELIYSSDTQEDFIFNLKIHHSIFSESVSKGTVYLGKYVFTNQPIQSANNCLKTTEEVLSLLEQDRLEEKAGRKIIITSEKDKNDVKVFSSIKDCLIFLNTIAPSNKTTLYRYVQSGKPYHGFICKFDNEETVSLSDKSIQIVILDTHTNISTVYSTIRKAALSFAPNIKTTGPTIKAYVDSGKLFKDRYLIKLNKDKNL